MNSAETESVISQLSEETPMRMVNYKSPFVTSQAKKSSLVPGSQLSQCDSYNWFCSPPVGLAKREDILGGCTPIVESLEASFAATAQSQELSNEWSRQSQVVDGNETQVKVVFHGIQTEVSPIVVKLRKCSSSLLRADILVSPSSDVPTSKPSFVGM